MEENRSAAVVTPSSAGVAIVEPPKRLRAKLTNNPIAARASRNTARGRRIADLYRAYAIALGSPSDTVTLSNVLAAAELKAASDVMRDKLLAGADVDPRLRAWRTEPSESSASSRDLSQRLSTLLPNTSRNALPSAPASLRRRRHDGRLDHDHRSLRRPFAVREVVPAT
jgi:hypothetical protein